jgi:S1-C subfamily serine protease
MNVLSKLSLVLGVAITFLAPNASQAFDPPRRDWSHRDRIDYRHHHDGLRITTVGYRSPAAYAGLERGDVIIEVDGRDVDRPEELHRALHRTGSRGVLTVLDNRSGRIREVRVNPDRGHIGVNVVPVRFHR